MLTYGLIPFGVPKWSYLEVTADLEKGTIGTFLASRARN